MNTQPDINERAQLLWDEDTFIDTSIHSENIINLQHLKNFFVEVARCTQDNKIIEAPLLNRV